MGIEEKERAAEPPEIVYYVASSLDGRIATPDRGVAWLEPFEVEDEDYGYAAFYASVDAVILGRRTYEQCLSFATWPYPAKPCWVFSRRPLEPARPEVTFTSESPAALVARFAAEGVRRAWLVGGAELAASFRNEGLIHEYVVSVIPMILGEGIPLLAPGGPRDSLVLAGVKPFGNGVIQLRYLWTKGLEW